MVAGYPGGTSYYEEGGYQYGVTLPGIEVWSPEGGYTGAGEAIIAGTYQETAPEVTHWPLPTPPALYEPLKPVATETGIIPSAGLPGDFAVPTMAVSSAILAKFGSGISQPGVATLLTSLVTSGAVAKALATVKSWFGKSWWKVLLALVGIGLLAAAIAWIIKKFSQKKSRRKRYSIGTNPRLGTLIKVSRRCDNITSRFLQRARHAGLIKYPGRTVYRRSRRYAHAR